MLIKRKEPKSYINWMFSKLFRIKTLWITMVIFGLICLIFLSILYGGYLNKTRQNIKLGKFVISLIDLNFSFVSNKLHSLTYYIDEFNIDIKHLDFEKLKYSREKALDRVGGDKVDEHIRVPAKLNFKDQTYNIRIGLTGIDQVEPNSMHIIHPNKKWSYAIKVKNNDSILGMQKFSLLVPRARGYLTDWIATKLYQSRGGIGIRNNFIDVNINGEKLGIFYLEERYDSKLLEYNNKKEGVIFRIINGELKIHSSSKLKENQKLRRDYLELKHRWESFKANRIKANEFFNYSKIASLVAISDLMNSKHALGLWNLRFYYDATNQLCEPIAREWGYLQTPVKNRFIKLFDSRTTLFITEPKIETPYHIGILTDNPIFPTGITTEFKELYIQEVKKIVRPSFLDSVLYSNNYLDSIINKVYKENPFYEFPIEVLKKNQLFMRDKIYPSKTLLMGKIKSIENDSIKFELTNMYDLPIEITGLKYNSRREIELGKRIILEANFEAINQSKEISVLNNFKGVFSDSLYNYLEVNYSVLGIGQKNKSIVLTY